MRTIMLMLCTVFSITTKAFGQTQERGDAIHFEQELTWRGILEKARRENRHIFVHCTATWCVPCKKMEKQVYTVDSIVDFINGNFIAVKAQMDSSLHDNAYVKNWYGDAALLKEKHAVTGFPTYLFFTPSGDIVYKDEGFRKPEEFMSLIRKVIDPDLPYYKLLQEYKAGDRHDSILRHLALQTEWLDKERSGHIAHEYTTRLLNTGDSTRIYDDENLRLMALYTRYRKDPAYNFFYQNQARIDAAMKEEGYSRAVIDLVITNEFITPYITDGTKLPDWKKIENEISRHYDKDYAGRNVLWERALWHARRGDNQGFVKYAVLKVNKYGVIRNWYGDLLLNHIAWQVFLYSDDKDHILSALKWMPGVTERITDGNKANALDTYANLLYKSNRKGEAIKVQKRAIALMPDRKEFRENLQKMERGEPTWKVQ